MPFFPSSRGLGSAIVIPVAAFAAIAILALLAVLSGAVGNADNVAVERQRRQVVQAVAARIEKISYDQESVTIWDDAVLAARKGDTEWLHVNLGSWMFSYFDHDRTAIVAPDGRVIYAMAEGNIASPELGERTVGALEPIFAEARRQLVADNRPEKVVVRDQLVLEGRPAIVSVMPLMPHTDRVEVAPGDEFLFLSVQFHDRAFVRVVSDQLLLDGARILGPGAQPVGTSIPLVASRGTVVGALAWQPELPGSRILWAIMPVGAITLVLILAGFLLAARLQWRTLHRLEASEVEARYLAGHDALSRLPNRWSILARIDRNLALAAVAPRSTALILLDLDRFKEINDTLGHHTGDELIRKIADRFGAVVRDKALLGRLGGDEFAVVMDSVEGEEEVRALCEAMLQAVSDPFVLSDAHLIVGVSIGAALSDASVDSHELFRRADIALYAAKHDGRNCYRVFRAEMDAGLQRRRRIETELRAALADGAGLDLAFQPIVDAASGRIAGIEALLRWTSPTLGPLPPADFIPIAEERGLILDLDEWVLAEACRAASHWHGLSVAVNMSPRAFKLPGVAARVRKVLTDVGFDARRLEIEITETVFANGYGVAEHELRRLRGAGVRIALDDFGTGYSSLAHLREFEVDKIKIDQTFVRQLGRRGDSAAIVNAIVGLGRAIGITVTAEGVETEAQAEHLSAIGCEQLQGYHFSAPLPRSDIEELLAKGDLRASA